jgi:GNAT-family acetyltransferase (TIGR03103 family)
MTGLDPTSKLIIEEAQRRGIAVEILAPRAEYFRLRHGGRVLSCRESLSELTSAVAVSRCDDKRVTSQLLSAAGLSVPAQIEAGNPEVTLQFMREHGSVVVKPTRGEQGRGVSVGISSKDELEAAIARATACGSDALLEEMVSGEELRIIVIGEQVVAASVRRPPEVVGDGERTIFDLIALQSAKRSAATAGHSRIPLDTETERCVREHGFELNDVLPRGQTLVVRKAANLHLGGTLDDVTPQLNFKLVEVARRAARTLELPVLGLDMIVGSVRQAEPYWIIEANERPGLANHEPQPTAARFVDLLFPETAVRAGAA